MQAGLSNHNIEDFYALSRACLIKDEKYYDKFDLAFGEYFKGIQALPGLADAIPEDWLKYISSRYLSDEAKAALERMGLDKLLDEFQKRLEEQKGRHEGGNKWIGTGGSSPFGHSGYHPEGMRMGGESAGHRSAIKVWENREFRNLDGTLELGTRNIKVALKTLRKFARSGAADELDLEGTIASTARNAGWLDLKMRPERRNAIKVLLFLDVGGSMDDHIQQCEELFSAARQEFKHLEYFYFHNCIYDHVWRDNRRRRTEAIPLYEVLHKYGSDYKLIIVGDASMAPSEILHPNGSVEYNNAESGQTWMTRLLATYPHAVWLNPEAERMWQYTRSIGLIRELMQGRMYPLTLDGLGSAMQELRRK